MDSELPGITTKVRKSSARADQNISRIFFGLSKGLFTPNFTVEFSQTGGLESQVV